jgi:hypothetical protein
MTTTVDTGATAVDTSTGTLQEPISTSGSTSSNSLQEPIATPTGSSTSSNTKVPRFFIHKTQSNTDGTFIWSTILDLASTATFTESLQHGKMRKWLKEVHSTAFDADKHGVLSMYEKPVESKFLRLSSEAKSIIEELLLHKHSCTDASDDEAFPPHLKDLVTKYRKMKVSSEDASSSQTQSQKNRTVQDNIIGNRVPMGPNQNNTLRASTTAENRRNGVTVAERGNHMAGALTNISKSNEQPTKKQKSAKSNVSSILEENLNTRAEMIGTLKGFLPSKDSNDYKNGELNLKKEAFSHRKDMDMQKISVENRKVNLERERMNMMFQYKREKRAEKKDQAMMAMMKLEYEKAFQDVKDNAGTPMHELYMDIAKDTYNRYKLYCNKWIEQSTNAHSDDAPQSISVSPTNSDSNSDAK